MECLREREARAVLVTVGERDGIGVAVLSVDEIATEVHVVRARPNIDATTGAAQRGCDRAATAVAIVDRK